MLNVGSDGPVHSSSPSLLSHSMSGGRRYSILDSNVAAAVGLFAVGASLSLFTGRGALRSGLRMVLIGGGAGVVTYLIGMLFGVAAN